MLIVEKSVNNNTLWWSKIHYIAVVGFFLRLLVAFLSDNIHHPDEIFQYLEQAHRAEFGYGYIPWEYRFGIRSWILPGLISLILHLCHTLHLDDPYFYIPLIKTFFCLLSLSLIYSCYIIGRNVASEEAGRLAAILVCFWYELIYFAHKPNPEVLAAYFFIAALACVVIQPSRLTAILFGFFLATSAILRFQYLPAIAILAIFIGLAWKTSHLFTALIIFLLTVFSAGYVDYLTWGGFFSSYYNNYLFNKVYKVNELFGKEPVYYLLKTLTITSAGIFPIIGVLSLTQLKKTWLLLLCALSIILSHSIITHKEHRFIFVVIPLFLIMTAIIINQYITKKFLLYSIMVFLLTISINSSFFAFPLQKQIYGMWQNSIFSQETILKAYSFLSQQPDLKAILNIYSSWVDTGGYYYLHQDVPIYLREHLPEEKIDFRLYFSHIVCHDYVEEIPGFQTIVKIENLEIRKQINPPTEYKSLDVDTKNVWHYGIDDKYKPIVNN